MKILNVTDTEFKVYGKVLEGYDTAELLKAMEHAPLPLDEVIYEPSIEELEALKDSAQNSKTGVVLPETTKESTEDESSAVPEVTKPAEQKKTSSMKTVMTTILLLALGAVGAYYYFKIYKPGRPKEDDGENQGMEQEDFPDEEDDSEKE